MALSARSMANNYESFASSGLRLLISLAAVALREGGCPL